MECSECGQEFQEGEMIAYCEEHDEYFHIRYVGFAATCEREHSRNKHGSYYREARLIDGKLTLI
jgi:threonine synthase